MTVLFPASHPTDGSPMIVEYKERGYIPVSHEVHADKSDYWVWPEDVTQSAIDASMFGWDCPAADKAVQAAEQYLRDSVPIVDAAMQCPDAER